MYWRIRKYGPLDVLRKYGLHMILVLSLLFNCLLVATRPNLKKVITTDVKIQLENFARQVTNHILDTSYISYGASTSILIDPSSGELDLPVITELRRQQLLPNTSEELKANIQTYTNQRRVVAVRIDRVDTGEAVIVNGASLIPIDISGVVAVHSADEAGPPSPFHFRYLVGYRGNTQSPLVANFKDLSG